MQETALKKEGQIPADIIVEEDLEADQEVIDIEEEILIPEVPDREVIGEEEELEDIEAEAEVEVEAVEEEEAQVTQEVVDIEEIVKEAKINIKIRIEVIVEVIKILTEVENQEVLTVNKIEMNIKKMKKIFKMEMKILI